GRGSPSRFPEGHFREKVCSALHGRASSMQPPDFPEIKLPLAKKRGRHRHRGLPRRIFVESLKPS
ncbi:MAG: hypothetical protein ACK53L_16475, partial [Pirellulaceae bacterium]